MIVLIWTMNNLGHTYRMLNQLGKAARLFEEALDLRKRILPSSHPYIGDTMYNVAVAYNQLGRIQKALALIGEALAMYKRSFPPGHSEINDAEKMVAMYRSNVDELCSMCA